MGWLRLVALASLLALTVSTAALAAPGDLDSSFDGDGIRTVDFLGTDTVRDVVVQPDGRIVAAGFGFGIEAGEFTVARVRLDGSLDPSFKGNGKATINFGTQDFGQAAALQPDGKVVMAGEFVPGGGSSSDLGLLRLTAAGDLDPTFSGDGKEAIDFGGEDDAYDVLVQPDGRIVVAGSVFGDLAVVRRNADGSQDTGARSVEFGGAPSQALAAALQPDGKIVAVGLTQTGDNSAEFAVARFNADLSAPQALDATFDGDGRRTIAFPGAVGVNSAKDVLVQPDGKIVVIGDGTGFLLGARLNPDGSLDTSFDGDGKVQIEDAGSATNAAALQANGKIVIAGSSGTTPRLLRLQPGGALDTTFSGDGRQPLPVTGVANAVALLRDGRIVAAGESGNDALVALVEGDSLASGGGPGGGGTGGGGPKGGKSRVPRCAGKRATIVGTNKANRLKGTRRADVVVALGGDDRIDGGHGNDLICAGDGNDSAKGSTGNDRLYGQNGKDRLDGGKGSDRLAGDAGKDALVGGSGKDRLAGGGGRDSCNGGAGQDRARCEGTTSL